MSISATVFAAPSAVTVNDNSPTEPPIFMVSPPNTPFNNDVGGSESVEQADASIATDMAASCTQTMMLCGESISECLTEGFENLESEIDISDFGMKYSERQKLANIFGDTLRTNADLYYISFNFKFRYNSKKVITKVIPQYLVTDITEIQATQNALHARINEIISLTDDSMSDVEKLLTIYTEAILSCEYDHSLVNRHAKTLLLDGTTVCNGYASAMYVLADRLGIEGGFVTSEELNHIWNSFCIDGVWYHLDATWDDSVPGESLTVRYVNFLKSDSWMTDETGHYGFEYLGNDDTAKFDDYLWNEANTSVILASGKIYCFNSKKQYTDINCFDPDTKETVVIYTFTNFWPSSIDNKWSWNDTLSGLGYSNNRLYFNTDTQILSCKLDGSDIRVEYVPDLSVEESIGGCCRKGNMLQLNIVTKETLRQSQTLYMPLTSDNVSVETQSGISLRTRDIFGMRFMAKLGKEDNSSAFGWIVTREALLESAGIELSDFTIRSKVKMLTEYNYGNGVERAILFDSTDEHDFFAAVVFIGEDEQDGFPPTYQLKSKFVARPFAVVNGETVYGDVAEPTSLYDVALYFYNDSERFSSLSDEVQAHILGLIAKVESSKEIQEAA